MLNFSKQTGVIKLTNLELQMEFACADNQSLRGAAVNAHLSRFLERTNADTPGAWQFVCRICGRAGNVTIKMTVPARSLFKPKIHLQTKIHRTELRSE